MEAITVDTPVGKLVAARPSRSRVFGNLGIDFCCGGRRSLADACRSRNLDPHTVVRMLQAADTGTEDFADAAAMSLSDLCDHIEATHHASLRTELPRLRQMAAKVAAVHGDAHPWTREVHAVFAPFEQELTMHMMKEEQVLFPLIRGLEADADGGLSPCGGTIAHPVRVMEMEHDHAGEALAAMRELSHGYTPPDGACNTFRALLDGLRELEDDMHQHVHKENNVLFPRALELEQERQASAV